MSLASYVPHVGQLCVLGISGSDAVYAPCFAETQASEEFYLFRRKVRPVSHKPYSHQYYIQACWWSITRVVTLSDWCFGLYWIWCGCQQISRGWELCVCRHVLQMCPIVPVILPCVVSARLSLRQQIPSQIIPPTAQFGGGEYLGAPVLRGRLGVTEYTSIVRGKMLVWSCG